jgi:hypothetical protein
MLKSLLKSMTHSVQTLWGRRPWATRRRKRTQQSLRIDDLEPRLLMTVRVWDGGAALNDKWSDPKNWVGDVAPVFAQDDLVFPAGVGLLDRSTRNDFGFFVVKSIRFEGTDYKITGGRIGLNDRECGNNRHKYDRVASGL